MHISLNKRGHPNDDIPSQQEGAFPNHIIILYDQKLERDTVEHVDEDTDNNQIPPPLTGYPRPTHPPPTWYPRPTHRPYLEQLYQYIVNTNIRVIRSFRRKQNIYKILMTMSSIFQDTIINNERETGDSITG